MRASLWVLLALWLTASPSQAEAPILMERGDAFLDRDGASRASYVAGLSDQLIQLQRAGLLRGFGWYERCVARVGAETMASVLADYIAAERSRAEEPAARNLIWAAAEVCDYP